MRTVASERRARKSRGSSRPHHREAARERRRPEGRHGHTRDKSPYKGYWPARGWSDTAIYKTFSRIDAPAPGAVLKRGARAWIAGVAFGGDRGIRAVEVSVDEGTTWQPTRLKPGMGDHTWLLWAFEWTPAATGPATLMVRAIDGTGALQPVGPKPPLPDGVEGLHAVSVKVR